MEKYEKELDIEKKRDYLFRAFERDYPAALTEIKNHLSTFNDNF